MPDQRSGTAQLFQCMCIAYEAGDPDLPSWRPCPPSLCERKTHALAHRLATSGRDYRYGGFGAWLRWVLKAIPADEED